MAETVTKKARMQLTKVSAAGKLKTDIIPGLK